MRSKYDPSWIQIIVGFLSFIFGFILACAIVVVAMLLRFIGLVVAVILVVLTLQGMGVL